ncbi:copper resistance protein CopC [Kineococcus gynurae]|uniref:Copper resistance protein CopC n=1 Tax=Kineococcus gynurae TaxID=452979 RepID=A0ABV5LX48_9ACTN
MSRSLLRPTLSRLRPFALGLVLVTGGVIATATPSSAHDRLVSSDPTDGASLATAPDRVTLTYNNEVLQVGSEIGLSTAAGDPVPTDPATVDGKTVSVPWPAGQGGGEYTVVWRVVSSDGHPIDGTLRFSVAGTPTTSAPATASPDPSATSAAPGATPDSTPAADESDAADGSGPSGLLVGGIVVLVLLIVVGAVAVVRRRSS